MKKRLLALLFILVSFPFYAQWDQQISGVTNNLNDVYCISPDLVIIVGDGGMILKTTDGGEHWVQKTSGATTDLKNIQFINSSIGFIVGTNGTFLKSVDSGETWNLIATGLTTDLYGLSCVNENILFISGDNGLIKKTIDGGATFSDQSYASTNPFVTIQFLNEQVGYASSYNPPPNGNPNSDSKFIKTVDGGLTWTLTPNQYITSFYFLTENIGFISDGNGISKTIDGGLNLSSFGASGFVTPEIFSLNENVVWSVNNNFALCGCAWFCINKTDLAATPELQQLTNCYPDYNNHFPFMAIHFANETSGYAVGLGGTILKNSTGTMIDNPQAISAFTKKDFINIYPNPASNQITISFIEKQTAPFSIEITDFLGKKIWSKSYENQNDTTIGLEDFSKGVYFVKLQSNKGNSVQKLIKE